MKGDKRRIKKIVTGLVILVLLGITLSVCGSVRLVSTNKSRSS